MELRTKRPVQIASSSRSYWSCIPSRLYETLLTVVTDKLLPERPYRYEPRLKKQRPKPYGWMQQPRKVLKSHPAVA